jgi:outer membrane protein TolC
MRKRIIAALLLFVLEAPVFAQGAQERVFNIDQSVFYAMRNRKDALLGEKEVEVARERIKEAESFLYPKIDMTFNYSNIFADRFTVLPPTFGSILIPRNTPGEYYTTRFSLWQNVYSGGLYSSNIIFAKSNLVRVENQAKVITNDIVFDVKKAFYNLLVSKQKIEAYESAISSAEWTYVTLKSQTAEEELQASWTISAMKDDYSALMNSYEKQKLDYLNTLGLELDTDFRVEGSLDVLARDYDINKLLAWAFQYRPEPKQIQAQEEIDALSVKLSLSARYPTVALGMHYEFPGQTLSFENKNWNATVSFNLPIYDGWASWSKIRQRKIQAEQNKLKKKELEDSIRLDVRKAFFDYNYRTKEAAVKKERLDRAAVLMQRFPGAGLSEGLKILRFHLEAKIEYINSKFEHIRAMAAIEHAVGKSLAQE